MLATIKAIFTVKSPKLVSTPSTIYLYCYDNSTQIKNRTEVGKNPVKRISVAEEAYYLLAKPYLTKAGFHKWLLTLNDSVRSECIRLGFQSCKNMLKFKRFVLENNGYTMDSFMKEVLSAEDYNFWESHH